MKTDNKFIVKKLNAGWDKNEILKNISFEVEKKSLVCVCGPNGCGKSTLLKIMDGIKNSSLKVNEDAVVEADGLNIFNADRNSIAKKIAYLVQNENFVWNSDVEDLILTGRFSCSKNKFFYTEEDKNFVQESMDLLEIKDLSGRNIQSLSGGELQKVRIARCLVSDPDYLILDEPLAALDVGFEDNLLKLLRKVSDEKGCGLVISVHDINLASRFADKVLLMTKDHQYFFGITNEVLTEVNLKKAYGVDFGSFMHPEFEYKHFFKK